MELKSVISDAMPLAEDCFNRTFMELKLNTIMRVNSVFKVLIVPLWN